MGRRRPVRPVDHRCSSDLPALARRHLSGASPALQLPQAWLPPRPQWRRLDSASVTVDQIRLWLDCPGAKSPDVYLLPPVDGSLGPQLGYGESARATPGQFGAWAPIAAERRRRADTRSPFRIGHCRPVHPVWTPTRQGNWLAPERLECRDREPLVCKRSRPSFSQDLNGSGAITASTTVVRSVWVDQPGWDRGQLALSIRPVGSLGPQRKLCRRGRCRRSVRRDGRRSLPWSTPASGYQAVFRLGPGCRPVSRCGPPTAAATG